MDDTKPSTLITAEFRPIQSTDKLRTIFYNSMQQNKQKPWIQVIAYGYNKD